MRPSGAAASQKEAVAASMRQHTDQQVEVWASKAYIIDATRRMDLSKALITSVLDRSSKWTAAKRWEVSEAWKCLWYESRPMSKRQRRYIRNVSSCYLIVASYIHEASDVRDLLIFVDIPTENRRDMFAKMLQRLTAIEHELASLRKLVAGGGSMHNDLSKRMASTEELEGQLFRSEVRKIALVSASKSQCCMQKS